MRGYSEYEKWLLSKYKGVTPKECIDLIVEKILSDTEQNEFPIDLSRIAKAIGIIPTPLYQNQEFEGSVVIKENKLRVALKSKNYQAPGINNKNLSRMRFTYAHELMHCVAFDTNSKIPKRIAPLPKGNEEEYSCNYGARKMLLPSKLLTNYFNNLKGTTAEKIYSIANIAKASIQAVVIQLFECNILPVKNNFIYILSAPSKGYRQRGEEKVRCIASVFFNNSGEKYDFLKTYQGINKYKSMDLEGDENWSLLKVHGSIKHNIELKEYRTNRECIKKIEDRSGKNLCISGTHTRINSTRYVWSELYYNMDNFSFINERLKELNNTHVFFNRT